jgi:hypothetical protein
LCSKTGDGDGPSSDTEEDEPMASMVAAAGDAEEDAAGDAEEDGEGDAAAARLTPGCSLLAVGLGFGLVDRLDGPISRRVRLKKLEICAGEPFVALLMMACALKAGRTGVDGSVSVTGAESPFAWRMSSVASRRTRAPRLSWTLASSVGGGSTADATVAATQVE